MNLLRLVAWPKAGTKGDPAPLKRRNARGRADLGGATRFFNILTFAKKVLEQNQGHHVKALKTRISTRQSRGLGKIGFLTKKHHCRGYPNPPMTNTRQLGQTSSSEKSEGTLSQQFAKVLTQSALSFSSRDHQGFVSFFFFTAKAVMANGKKIKYQGTKSTAPSTSRLAGL